MTTSPNDSTIDRLISIEAHVHYGEPPPPGVPAIEPFVCVARDSHVLISAPHGTRTFRDSIDEAWHEEDEYTAGMALLLSERCGTSVIANVWRSDKCDPNHHSEEHCFYKQALRKLVAKQGVRWVVDLHGAAQENARMGARRVDLGTRKTKQSMNAQHRDKLHELIESALGKGTVSHDVFAAWDEDRITAFCQEELKVQAIQIEMKPSVRIPFRRCDASSFAKQGPFSATPEDVMNMLGALEAFINYLKPL
jgi:hypothetical protein